MDTTFPTKTSQEFICWAFQRFLLARDNMRIYLDQLDGGWWVSNVESRELDRDIIVHIRYWQPHITNPSFTMSTNKKTRQRGQTKWQKKLAGFSESVLSFSNDWCHSKSSVLYPSDSLQQLYVCVYIFEYSILSSESPNQSQVLLDFA